MWGIFNCKTGYSLGKVGGVCCHFQCQRQMVLPKLLTHTVTFHGKLKSVWAYLYGVTCERKRKKRRHRKKITESNYYYLKLAFKDRTGLQTMFSARNLGSSWYLLPPRLSFPLSSSLFISRECCTFINHHSKCKLEKQKVSCVGKPGSGRPMLSSGVRGLPRGRNWSRRQTCRRWEAGCPQAAGLQSKGMRVHFQFGVVVTRFDPGGNETPGQSIARGRFGRKFGKQNSHVDKLISLIGGGGMTSFCERIK